MFSRSWLNRDPSGWCVSGEEGKSLFVEERENNTMGQGDVKQWSLNTGADWQTTITLGQMNWGWVFKVWQSD